MKENLPPKKNKEGKPSSRLSSSPESGRKKISLSPGKGWAKRNFLSDVLFPSLFLPRKPKSPPPALPPVPPGKFALTWIGHSAFLVRTPEHCILIDPLWSKWLKVVKRLSHPGILPYQLPAIDLVLITHAHFDHLDKSSLRKITDKPPIIVPDEVGSVVKRLGFERIHEMRTWEILRHGHLRITFTPAAHWGARVLHDTHRGFGGYLIEYAGRSIFHCGDSSYFDGFTEIGKRTHIAAALLPIGAYDPPSQRSVHMNPEEAVQTFLDLQAKVMLPMHYGAFRLSYEPLDEPLARLQAVARKKSITKKLIILEEGQTSII